MRIRFAKYLYCFSDRVQIASKKMEKQQQMKKEYKYLKKAERVKGVFDLRFDKIKNSMVTGGLSAAFTFLKYRVTHGGDTVREPSTKEDFIKLQQEIPQPKQKPSFKHNFESQIRYTWIGHSTAMIQVGQANILIDPVFSDRCSFTQWAGPKRYRKPACEIKDLEQVNIVLVSHDHYDHLDESSLDELNKLYKPTFVAGLGSKGVFPKNCTMREMDWMDQLKVNIKGRQFKVTFVPVCHWSRRGAFDFNERLWGGFVIETPYKTKIFYSGDTAYTEVFKEIGDAYGPFDLAILPIGAYLPRHLLSPQHVDPEEAVQIHLDIKSKKSVGVHWGTFPLGFEAFYQPKYDLMEAKKKLKVDDDKFITVKHGESIVVG